MNQFVCTCLNLTSITLFFRANGVGSPSKDAHRLQMGELVAQHTDQCSELKTIQMKEVHELILAFVDARRELLLKVGLFGQCFTSTESA